MDEANIRSSIEEHEQLLKAIRLHDAELASPYGATYSRRFQTPRTDLKLIEGCPNDLV